MLWVYGHYKYVYSDSAEIDFRRIISGLNETGYVRLVDQMLF